MRSLAGMPPGGLAAARTEALRIRPRKVDNEFTLVLGEGAMDCAFHLTGRKTLPFLYRLGALFPRSSFEPKAGAKKMVTSPAFWKTDRKHYRPMQPIVPQQPPSTPHPNG